VPTSVRPSSAFRSALSCLSDEKIVEKSTKWLAGGLGFEPRLTESESAVLPLNYPPS
jgi:hypothetical protein